MIFDRFRASKQDFAAEYALIRSRRKSIALYIRSGGIEVRAPFRLPKRDIDRFVASKERWITEHLMKSQADDELRKAFILDYGDVILFRGREYLIRAKESLSAEIEDGYFFLPPNLPPQDIKERIVGFYRLTAKEQLALRVSHFAGIMNVSPIVVKISGAKTRWGSCSANKSLNFSWRLMMADNAVIDYVVVHELAHIIEMNHGARFWSVVAGILPDYKERQKRLKALQHRLNTEDWK